MKRFNQPGQNQKAPTIRDIARRAGVSVGSVSNYLNNPEKVGRQTREAIRLAIEQLGYHPKAAARSLRTKQTFRIGMVPVISPRENRSIEPSDLPFLDFLSGVNTAAAERGFAVLLHAATSPAQELQIYRQLVGEGQVDGFILTATRPHDPRVEFLREERFPFVAFGRSENVADLCFVDVDGAKGMAEAVAHLARLGHRRIAYIAPPRGLMCAVHRWEGFQRAMAEHGLSVDPDLVIEGGFSERSGQITMHLLLDLPDPPTAVIAANDLCAFGAMRALRARGLVPGQDVSVIGFDDISIAAHWDPPLTTLAQPLRRIGSIATGIVIASVVGEEVERQVLIEPQLVVRSSTGPARK